MVLVWNVKRVSFVREMSRKGSIKNFSFLWTPWKKMHSKLWKVVVKWNLFIGKDLWSGSYTFYQYEIDRQTVRQMAIYFFFFGRKQIAIWLTDISWGNKLLSATAQLILYRKIKEAEVKKINLKTKGTSTTVFLSVHSFSQCF